MRLRYCTRAHPADWLARAQGSRLLVLDVWIDASPDEIAKLRSFNMLRQDFIEGSAPCGVSSAVLFVIGAGSSWVAWSVEAEIAVMIGIALATVLFGWLAWRNLGKTKKTMIRVADLIGSAPVPFTRDNMAAIHDVVVAIDDRYQSLFGAMYEIEAYEVTRDAVWREREAMA